MIWRKYEKLTLLEALKTALSFFFNQGLFQKDFESNCKKQLPICGIREVPFCETNKPFY